MIETFDGIADGSPWPSPWYNSTQWAQGTADVTGGVGRLVTGNLGGWNWQDQARLNYHATPADVEVVYTMEIGSTDCIPNLVMRNAGNSCDSEARRMEIRHSGGTVEIRESGNYDLTTIDTVSFNGYTAPFRVRCRVQGMSFKIKFWYASDAEPAAWSSEVTLTKVDTSGSLGWFVVNGSSATSKVVTIRNVQIVNLASLPPAPAGGWPSWSLGAYLPLWSNNPGAASVDDVPPEVTELRVAFVYQGTAGGDPLGLVAYGRDGQAGFVSKLAAWRAARSDRRVVVSVGGEGYPIDLSDCVQCAADMVALHAQVPFDAWDFDVEAGSFTTEMVMAFARAVFYELGVGFTSVPHGGVVDDYLPISVAAHSEGLLLWHGQQFYSSLVTWGGVQYRMGEAITAGVPQARLGLGMMVASDATGWTNAECVSMMTQAITEYNTTRTYLWEVVRPGTAQWAADMNALLNPGTVTINAPTSLTGRVGTPLTATSLTAATSDGTPVHWTADALPPGVTLDPVTGVVYGTPINPGAWTTTWTARSGTYAYGYATTTWAITAYVPPVPRYTPLTRGWTYLATTVHGDGTETLLATSLPLTGVTLTDPISAAPEISFDLTPEIMRLQRPDGTPLIRARSTAIYAILDGVIRAGGIVATIAAEGPQLKITAPGFVSLIDNEPWTNTTMRFIGADPAAVIRTIWTYWQSHPRANIALQLPTGLTTGAKVGTHEEPVLLANYATSDLGEVFHDMLEAGSIDYRERHQLEDGTITHRLDMGAPRLGRRRSDIQFRIGTNTLVPGVGFDTDRYASEVLVLGAGEGDKMIRAHAYAPPTDRLRRCKVIPSKGIGRTPTAQLFAAKWAKNYAGDERDVTELTVVDTPTAPLFSWEPGDEVWLSGDSMWGGHLGMWVRVLSTTYTPDRAHTAALKIARADKAV